MAKGKAGVKKPTTIVNFILDKSGSMSSVQDSTISGVNEYISTLKKDKKSKYEFSLTLFDTEVTKPYVGVSLKDVKDLDKDTYAPEGMTALYDAVCKTIKGVKAAKNQKVITIIMTDGAENSSKEYTQVQMKALIGEREKEGNWTFVYLGANQDSYAVAQAYGISTGNTSNYNATNSGTRAAFCMMAQATSSFSGGGGGAGNGTTTTNFLSKDDQDLLAKTK